MKIEINILAKAAILSLLPVSAHALNASDYSFFTIPVTVTATSTNSSGSTITDSFSFSNFSDLETAFNGGRFTSDTDFYNAAGGDGIIKPFTTMNFDIQGNDLTLTSGANLSAIEVSSNTLGINQSFDGGSRSQSLKDLGNWFKDNAGNLVAKLNGGAMGRVTGNPSSFVSQMASFDQGIDGLSVLGAGKENTVSLAARFSSYSAYGKSVDLYTLPLSYSWEFGNGWAALFNLPLTYIDNNGVSSYSAALGTGIRIPVSQYINTGPLKWNLIPLFRVGAVGSDKNLAETSVIYSGGIQSDLGFIIGDGYALMVQNQYNHYLATSVGNFVNVKINGNLLIIPDIHNDVYRNGMQLVKDFNYKLFGRTLTGDFFFADTRFSGDALVVNNQQEIGFDIGLRASKVSAPEFTFSDALSADKITNKAKGEIAANDIKIGFTYTRAHNFDNAYAVNAGWTF